MDELNRTAEKPELFDAIRNSIGDARDSVKQLAEVFTDNIQPLRLEESEKVFSDLTQNILDLESALSFIKALNEGIRHLDGLEMPSDPISSGDSGLSLFKDMHSAMESRDWIMLSDLIEYELSPLLLKEDEWLGELQEKIGDCA